MRPVHLAAVLALCACSSGTDAPPVQPLPPQIEDLADSGQWELFEIESVTQRARDYTPPPPTFTLTGEKLSHVDRVVFQPVPFLSGYYGGEGQIISLENTFDQNGTIAAPTNWTTVQMRWNWVSQPTFLADELCILTISIDDRSDQPQILLVWQVFRFGANSVRLEESVTHALYRPAQ